MRAVARGHPPGRRWGSWARGKKGPIALARLVTRMAAALAMAPPWPGCSRLDFATSESGWTEAGARASKPRRVDILGPAPSGGEVPQVHRRMVISETPEPWGENRSTRGAGRAVPPDCSSRLTWTPVPGEQSRMRFSARIGRPQHPVQNPHLRGRPGQVVSIAFPICYHR